jgi:hypothetical protein
MISTSAGGNFIVQAGDIFQQLHHAQWIEIL